jgi:multiple sugar transport system substrate-binding protein
MLLCVFMSLVIFISGCETVTEQNSKQSPKIISTKIQLRVEVTNTSYYAGRMDTYNLMKQRFEKQHPETEILFLNAEKTPAGVTEKFDLVEVGTDMLLEQEPRLVDLYPLLKRDQIPLSDFHQSLLQQKELHSGLLAIPFYPEPLVVFYSKKWFDQAKLPYPKNDWTWEQHAEIATLLTNIAPRLGGQYGTSIPFDINWIEVLALSNGGSLLSPDGRIAKGYLDSPATIQAVEWLAKLIKNKSTALYTEQWNNGYGYAADLPAKSGMSVGYYYKLPEYLLAMGDDLGVAALPHFASGIRANVMFTWGHGVRKDSVHQDLAWELLREMFITDKEVLRHWAKTDLLSTKSAALTHQQNQNPNLAVFINEFQHAKYPTTLLNKHWSGSDLKIKLINPELRQIITTDANVKSGLAQLADKIDAALAEKNPID